MSEFENKIKIIQKRAGQDGLYGLNVQTPVEKVKKSASDFAKTMTIHAKDLIMRLNFATK